MCANQALHQGDADAGVIAAINSLQSKFCQREQYRIISTLGGMIGPKRDAEDMTAAANSGE
jgi:hypothetical protein